MIIAIMQPTYLPWIGYFDMIDQVDRFVFLDDAQVLKRSWGVRNRIVSQGKEAFLTVPLSGHSQSEDCNFTNTALDPSPKWRSKHLSTIRHAYAKAPFFAETIGLLEGILDRDNQTIGSLNMRFIEETANAIGIATPCVRSSQMRGVEGRKDTRLLSICMASGADNYLAAPGSAAYIEQDRESGAFGGSGVALHYHQYDHPTYSQSADPFISHMSIVDLLMQYGFDAALDIIRSGRRPMLASAELRKELA